MATISIGFHPRPYWPVHGMTSSQVWNVWQEGMRWACSRGPYCYAKEANLTFVGSTAPHIYVGTCYRRDAIAQAPLYGWGRGRIEFSYHPYILDWWKRKYPDPAQVQDVVNSLWGHEAGHILLYTTNQNIGLPLNDAMRARLRQHWGPPPTPPAPPLQFAYALDDSQPGFATTGPWVQDNPGQGWKGGEWYSHPNSGLATASWTFGVPPGLYAAYMTWFPWMNRASNTPITIRDGEDMMVRTTVDQRFAPSDGMYQGVGWKLLWNFRCNSGLITVEMSNAANNYVIADAVGLVSLTQGVMLPRELDVQEASEDMAAVGLWGRILSYRPAFRTHVIRPEDLE